MLYLQGHILPYIQPEVCPRTKRSELVMVALGTHELTDTQHAPLASHAKIPTCSIVESISVCPPY